MPELAPIVIAYDGSEAARAAVNEAAALFGSRHAIVITVWEPGLADFMLMPGAMGTGTMMMPYDPATVQEIDKAAEDHARDIAEDGMKLAQAGGLEAEALAVPDAVDVADTILSTAKERDAAAIVIGSRGLKGFKSKLMGSSSTSVLSRSERPVVVVHQPGTREH
ncbi:MAG TPA: universal stress protein [Solirubrobacteraceae bacterium]|nr:universal stress protein [Solirubrobacteraceae bacterium]